MSADPMMQVSEPLTVAARRVEGIKASTERVVDVTVAMRHRDLAAASAFADGQIHGYDAAQEEGFKLLAAERANYEGAMADLAALVDVARKAVEGVRNAGSTPFAADEAVIPLARFLDSNHPVDGDRPEPMHIIRRTDSQNVHGDGYGFMSCDGPDDWQVAEDNEHPLYDEKVEYEILACRVVNTRTFGETEEATA